VFIHDSHLPQVLGPEGYVSDEFLELEMEHLFRPAWHFIGTLDDLPEEGSFSTFELFGKPLIIWRTKDGPQAFLNVCPHRFSMLTHESHGCQPERLVCQYHGWEFDTEGCTKKIPDAKSFRPMKKGELGLTQFRTETCGKLVFVSLAETGPGLEEFLGKGYEVGQELFGEWRQQILSLDYEVAANWKIKIENSLESYHVDLVHPATFKQTPDESICEHVLEPRWTAFATTQEATSSIERFLDRFIHRVAHHERDGKYEHFHFYPSMMYGKMALFSFAETVFPIAPGRTRIVAKFFALPGDPARLQSKLLFRGLRNYGRKFWPIVAAEDTSVMPDIQKGMESGSLPSRGLISVREERLFHFQEFIKAQTGGETPSEVSEPQSAAG
jgi:choline monooxygenase